MVIIYIMEVGKEQLDFVFILKVDLIKYDEGLKKG